METYLFYGTVLPERAQLSLSFDLEFSHIGSGLPGKAKTNIILNQVVVWIETDREWDIFDLRNTVKAILQNYLAMIGYLKGYAYDIEITRVLNKDKNIDYVFGIDIPCIEEMGTSTNLDDALLELREKTTGPNGIFVNRCLNDLVTSMKYADDTGFYCYRAIESLLNHCSVVHDVAKESKKKQWGKFREFSGCDEAEILVIKKSSDSLRHGGVLSIASEKRAEIFKMTWGIVDAYLKKI